MSLRDEIERLIKAETEKIHEQDNRFRENEKIKDLAFTPIKAALAEIRLIAPDITEQIAADSHAAITIRTPGRNLDYEKLEICAEFGPNGATDSVLFRVTKETPSEFSRTGISRSEKLFDQAAQAIEHLSHLLAIAIARRRAKTTNPRNQEPACRSGPETTCPESGA